MNKIFNWKISLISIISFGIITFIINLNGNIFLTIIAAFKEISFRFVWAGFLARWVQKISEKHHGIHPYILGTVIPTLVIFVLTFILHYFTYTPHPINTVVINTILTFFSGIGTVFLFKNGLMKV